MAFARSKVLGCFYKLGVRLQVRLESEPFYWVSAQGSLIFETRI